MRDVNQASIKGGSMNGERIKLARKRAGLSLRDLADKIDSLVSAQAIGKYERGEMTPSSEVLVALSKTLDVSIPYLMAPQAVELGRVDFRTKSTTSAKDRAKVETEVLEWVERYLQIEEILSLESAVWSVPEGLPSNITTPEDAEKLAVELREKWTLGTDPIPNMTELLEEKGIKVLIVDLPHKVSGLTCIVKQPNRESGTPVIIVNKGLSLERRRFTMAHELGHRLIAGEGLEERALEKLCDRFAGAFIATKSHLESEIGKCRSAFGYSEILTLKRLYRISGGAFLMRLAQIGAIDESAKEYAFRTFASGWRNTEPDPLESEKQRGEFEKPRRFERLVYRALAEDMISPMKAAELLRQSIAKVEEGLKGPARADANNR